MDETCQHPRKHKHGKDRSGRQRRICDDCGATFTDKPDRIGAGRISIEKEQAIQQLLQSGASVREIVSQLGVCRHTVIARRNRGPQDRTEPIKSPGRHSCDWCGARIFDPRHFHKPASAISGKFCNQQCYQSMYRWLRGLDRCRWCGMLRGNKSHRRMCRGYCATCYPILQSVGFDERLAAQLEITRRLEKEIRHVKRQERARRPTVNSHRHD